MKSLRYCYKSSHQGLQCLTQHWNRGGCGHWEARDLDTLRTYCEPCKNLDQGLEILEYERARLREQ